MKTISAIIAASILFSSTAAFAFGDIVLAPAAKEQPDRGNGTDHPFPYDGGRMNESPIRGGGQIHVSHNMPIPGDPDRQLHDAKWLLQDNGYQCSMPGRRR